VRAFAQLRFHQWRFAIRHESIDVLQQFGDEHEPARDDNTQCRTAALRRLPETRIRIGEKAALRYHADVWYVLFPEPGAWRGVVEIAYVGSKKPLGHAYAYAANRRTLRLLHETQRPGLKHGFACDHNGPALYEWTRSDDYTILRFTALEEPCPVRRRILEAEWSFVD
jgi:hypothetical protein